jgi:hypothetical protein
MLLSQFRRGNADLPCGLPQVFIKTQKDGAVKLGKAEVSGIISAQVPGKSDVEKVSG